MIEVRFVGDYRKCDFCDQRAAIVMREQHSLIGTVHIDESFVCGACLKAALLTRIRKPLKRSKVR